ncbi:MAG: YdcF family protein [Sphingomonas sp.]
MIRRLIVLLAVAWMLGFGLFMLLLPGALDDRKTDAIVVLTGGPGRIDRGLDLLQRHAAQRMLVSGVAPQVRPKELAAAYRRSPALFACCVDLGRQAVDTRSNADETAAWVRKHGYRTVRLVTSDWHLRRAKMELVVAMGNDAQIFGDGVPSSPRVTLLIAEYNKLIIRRIALWLGMGA